MDAYEQEQADKAALGCAEAELKRRELAIVELTRSEAFRLMRALTANTLYVDLGPSDQELYRKLERAQYGR